jgi:hypothetical protein
MIYRHWDGVAAFFRGVGAGLVSGLQPVISSFDGLVDSLGWLKPAFDAVGSALSTAWNWFTNLLQPVQYSSEELTNAGEAGKGFGEALATGINFVLTPLQMLIDGIAWVSANIGSVLDQAVKFKSAVGDGVGGAWQSTKQFFGFGDGQEAPAALGATVREDSSMPAPTGGVPAALALPQPAMATAKGGGPSLMDNSQTTFQIYQQPGQSNRQLAEEIARQQEQRRQVQQRGALYDGAMAQ